MKQNSTDITVVLDRSGSMQSIASDTIGGFNKFLSDQQAAPGEAVITLNQFDDVFEHVLKAVAISEAKPLNNSTFVPRGSTALLDAIGRSIEETGKRLESIPEDQRPSKVVVVIITDGHENASSKFSRQQIDEKIRHQRDNYQWEFVFLGANQDAIDAAAGIGIQGANSMTYAANTQGTTAAFASVSRNLRYYRAGDVQTMAFCASDRDDQKDAGV